MLGTKTSEKTLFLPSGSPSVSLVETDTLFICKLTDLSTSDSNEGHHSCAPSAEQGICTSLAWLRCFGEVFWEGFPAEMPAGLRAERRGDALVGEPWRSVQGL